MTNSYSLEELPIDPEETPVEMDKYFDMQTDIYEQLGGENVAMFKLAAMGFPTGEISERLEAFSGRRKPEGYVRDQLSQMEVEGLIHLDNNYEPVELTELGTVAETMVDSAVQECRLDDMVLFEEEGVSIDSPEDPETQAEVYRDLNFFHALGDGGAKALYASATDQPEMFEEEFGEKDRVDVLRKAQNNGLLETGASTIGPSAITGVGLERYERIVEPDYLNMKKFFEKE